MLQNRWFLQIVLVPITEWEEDQVVLDHQIDKILIEVDYQIDLCKVTIDQVETKEELYRFVLDPKIEAGDKIDLALEFLPEELAT